MPLFGKFNRAAKEEPPPPPPPEVSSHEFALKLSYSAKSSEGVRLKAGPGLAQRLHSMLAGYVQGETELIEPLPVNLAQASPYIARMPGSGQWLQYHHKRSPVTRHALVVLESVDAIDSRVRSSLRRNGHRRLPRVQHDRRRSGVAFR